MRGRRMESVIKQNRVCPWWLAYSFDNPFRRLLHDPRDIVGPFIREGMTVADIGCGLGYFSIAMAKMVGAGGRVIAVDLQQKMLDRMGRRAEKERVASRIHPILVEEDEIGIKEPLDFVLAFWMVHEVPDIPRFFSGIAAVLKETGRVLIAEPRMHVSRRLFEETVRYARDAGFEISGSPRIRISRAVVLSKRV